MLKLCRGYLNWVQNSSFEGELSEVKLKELKSKAKKIMNEDEDSLLIYTSRDSRWLNRETIGVEKMPIDEFL
ncbi:CRISPR-associated endoribonuclease Cas2 (plasmid) [Aureibacter tunicatorum]|nr:CRISPR-associated endoribonuclease Cas2 [Aureibacter tunicatorum]